jgi:hypothetical protein
MGYQIAGYDIAGRPVYQYEVGAPAAFSQQLAPRNAFLARQAPTSIMPPAPQMAYPPITVRETVQDESFLTPLGFNTSGTVTSLGGTGTASVQPQEVFTPRRLVIPDSLASDFSVFPISIGTKLQSVANVSMPAESFRGNVTGSNLKCATAQMNATISMPVVNNGNVTKAFGSTLYGVSVQ